MKQKEWTNIFCIFQRQLLDQSVFSVIEDAGEE